MSIEDSGFNKRLERPLPTPTEEAEADAEIFSPTFGGGQQGFVSSASGKYKINLPEDKITFQEGSFERRLLPSVSYTVAIDGSGDFGDIQEAIDRIRDLGGGTILIKPGTYRPLLQIKLYNNINLIGSGAESTIIDYTNAVLPSADESFVNAVANFALGAVGVYRTAFSGDIDLTSGSSSVGTLDNDVTSGGLQIGDRIISAVGTFTVRSLDAHNRFTINEIYRGNSIAGQSSLALAGDGIKNIFVSDLSLINGAFLTYGCPVLFKNGINVGVRNVTVNNWTVATSHLSASSGGSFGGIQVHNIINYSFVNNKVNDFKRTAGTLGAVVGLHANSLTFNGVIQANLATSITNHGVLVGGEYTRITNNYASGNGGSGFYVGTDNNNVLDNVAFLNTDKGILVGASFNLVIGNQCEYNGSDGVYVTGNNNVIAKNNVSQNSGYGVNIFSGSDNVLSHNMYNGNTLGERSLGVSSGTRQATRQVTIDPANAILGATDPADTNWTDLDVSSITTTRTYKVAGVVFITSTTAGRLVCMRRNGSSSGQDTTTYKLESQVAGLTSVGAFDVDVDSSRIFEWSVTNADVNDLQITITDYWDWAY